MSGISERARAAYDAVKDAPELRPDGFIRLIELRNLMPEQLLHLEGLDAAELEWIKSGRIEE